MAIANQTEKPASPWFKVGLMMLAMLVYTGSPIDLIPDFIPLFGQLDDLAVNGGFLALITRTVLKYYARKRLLKMK